MVHWWMARHVMGDDERLKIHCLKNWDHLQLGSCPLVRVLAALSLAVFELTLPQKWSLRSSFLLGSGVLSAGCLSFLFQQGQLTRA